MLLAGTCSVAPASDTVLTFTGGDNLGLTVAGDGSSAFVLRDTSTYAGAANVTGGIRLQVGDGPSGALAGSGAVTVKRPTKTGRRLDFGDVIGIKFL